MQAPKERRGQVEDSHSQTILVVARRHFRTYNSPLGPDFVPSVASATATKLWLKLDRFSNLGASISKVG